MSRDNLWGKNWFLISFHKSFRILSEIVWDFENIILMVGTTFLHVFRGLSERKKLRQIFFFKNGFGLWEKSFLTFGVLLIGRVFKTAFFLQEELCDKEQFFLQVNEKTIKNFWPPTVSFLHFRLKMLAGILEFNYSCPEKFS